MEIFNIKLKVIFINFFILGNLFSQTVILPKYFYKRLTGKIGNDAEIIMNLTRDDSLLNGNIYNVKNKKTFVLGFSSKIKSNKIFLEIDKENKVNNFEKFVGHFINENEISGEWIKQKSKMKCKLIEEYPLGSFKFDLKNEMMRDDSDDVQISFTFPVAKDFTELNNLIMNTILNNPMEPELDRKFQSVKEIMEAYISKCKTEVAEIKKNFPEYKMPMNRETDFNILVNSNNLLVIEIFAFDFSGGAHPISNTNFINFNMNERKEILLQDIFKDGFEKKLNQIGEKKFRRHFNIGAKTNLEAEGFLFEDGIFKLNNNFCLFPDGIMFLFNQYEVAPYSYGAPTVFISYSEVNEIIKEDLKKIIQFEIKN